MKRSLDAGKSTEAIVHQRTYGFHLEFISFHGNDLSEMNRRKPMFCSNLGRSLSESTEVLLNVKKRLVRGLGVVQFPLVSNPPVPLRVGNQGGNQGGATRHNSFSRCELREFSLFANSF